jgi:Gamma-glutamyl cyclotransferase, AIG2-like
VRRVDVFFYGLFMDPDLLRAKGVRPASVRPASVRGYVLRIGRRASLAPDDTGLVHGVVMALSHSELQQLYSDPGVGAYRPEAVLARRRDGGTIAALCFNLEEPPPEDEHDPEYAAKLRIVAERAGLPAEYVASIR